MNGCEIDSLPAEDRMVFERLFFEMFGVPRGVYGPVVRPAFLDGQEMPVVYATKGSNSLPDIDWIG